MVLCPCPRFHRQVSRALRGPPGARPEIGQTPTTSPSLRQPSGALGARSILLGARIRRYLTRANLIKDLLDDMNLLRVQRIDRSTRWSKSRRGCTSSSVLLNASTSAWGILLMNPTVSTSITLSPLGKRERARSRVKRREQLVFDEDAGAASAHSSGSTCRRWYSRPAPPWRTALRRAPCAADARVRSTVSSRFLRWLMRSRMRRRSTSSWVSPGPRVPMPPPSARQMRPLARQARQQIIQLRQLDLQLAFVACAPAGRRCPGSTGCGR